MAYCSKCGGITNAGETACRGCGTFIAAAAVMMAAPVATAAPAATGKPIEQSTAIIALVLNIIIWPGLGSIIAGEKIGWVQGSLTLLGVILVVTIIGMIIGIPLMLAMWIWGILTGVKVLNRANAQKAAATGAP